MGLKALIQQGWRDHEGKTAEVADRLEAGLPLVVDGDGAASFMQLVNHAIGDHLGDRSRARRLCEAAATAAGAEPGASTHVHLAVARVLAGEEAAAEAALLALGDDPAQRVRVGLLVAQGHANAGDWETAARIYDEQLQVGESLEAGHGAERAFAIVSNSIATEAMEHGPREATVDALMERAAQTSRTYWMRVGNWVNNERADYLLALVHNTLGRSKEAQDYADRALATIADADGEERVDEAFIHLARATACREHGDLEGHAASIATAEALAASFEDEGLTEWFQKDLAKAR